MRKEIIFLGSKPIGYHCLEYLLSVKDTLNINVVGLMTQQRKEFGDGKDLYTLASTHNIPLIQDLDELPACDIIYSVQYHKILKQHHIDKARQIAVNLHMAPLPEYRGSNQFSYAIIDGKKEFGTTIHKIDTRIDHGDILFQKRFPIKENCWVDELYEQTYQASLQLFRETLAQIVNDSYNAITQSSLEVQYGTALHFRNEIADLKQIDPSWDAEKINRYVRATFMPGFEPPYAIVNGEKKYYSRD